jgi:hypothetical protein
MIGHASADRRDAPDHWQLCADATRDGFEERQQLLARQRRRRLVTGCVAVTGMSHQDRGRIDAQEGRIAEGTGASELGSAAVRWLAAEGLDREVSVALCLLIEQEMNSEPVWVLEDRFRDPGAPARPGTRVGRRIARRRGLRERGDDLRVRVEGHVGRRIERHCRGACRRRGRVSDSDGPWSYWCAVSPTSRSMRRDRNNRNADSRQPNHEAQSGSHPPIMPARRSFCECRSIPLCVKRFFFRVFGRARVARDMAGL